MLALSELSTTPRWLTVSWRKGSCDSLHDSLVTAYLEEGERGAGPQTPGQAHQVVHWLPRVLDPPQTPGGLHAQVLHREILEQE